MGYLFGGYGEDTLGGAQELADLWAYDARANLWTELPQGDNRPSARVASVMVFDSRSNSLLLMFGVGPVGSGLYDDMWSYDVDTMDWSRLSPKGEVPSARRSTAAVYSETSNLVYLFGGLTQTGETNDTWAYDVASSRWSRLPSKGRDSPAPREGHSLFLDEDRNALMLLGGQNTWSSGPLSDQWEYGLGVFVGGDSQQDQRWTVNEYVR